MKHAITLLICLVTSHVTFSQSVTNNQNQDIRHLADRYAVLCDDSLINTSYKPLKREEIVEIAGQIDTTDRRDKYNRFVLESSNMEYTQNPEQYDTRRGWIKGVFYKNPSVFFGVNQPGVKLVMEPIVNYSMSGSNYSTRKSMFYNRRGFRVRGIIADRIAFQTELTDNQERGPHQFETIKNKYNNTVQGQGYFLKFNTEVDPYGVDYLDTRSTINFNIIKNYIDLTAGFDKNFIGDGYRSLLLSENSNSYLFTKLNAKFWRVKYQSITAELLPLYARTNQLADRKYMVSNYLTIDVLDNLTFGLFESVQMKRENGVDLMYLVPLIFLRSAERNIGSSDNSLIGGTMKWTIRKRGQIYGQLMFDEFKMDSLKNGSQYSGNKFGYQLGAKYFNAFGINTLDLQVETNWVRPFTYQHFSTDSNELRPYTSYSHYDQPLAHPLGAGFQELIFIAHYQPIPKVMMTLTFMNYNQGVDTGGVNCGNSPTSDYRFRNKSSDISLINGDNRNVNYLDLQTSYYLLPNISIDATFTIRNQKTNRAPDYNDFYFTLGFRANTFSRKYDY